MTEGRREKVVFLRVVSSLTQVRLYLFSYYLMMKVENGQDP